MAKIAEEWVQDGDKLVHIKKQDWNPMLDRAEELRQHGNAEFVESKLVDDVIKRKMLSGEFDKLRVWQGTY